jgi:1,4-alpha-glucan branching enzyme
MKHDRNKHRGDGRTSRLVHFEFYHPTATAVAVAGTFNDWRPQATQMVPLGSGQWRKELVLRPGQYEYRFVVDGEWIPDPLAKVSSPNPFGGINSILAVPNNA